jgi:hypothetical protein
MTGQVCNLLLQFTVTLVSKSSRTREILLSHLRLPHSGGPGSPFLYLPGTGWPSYTPGLWVPFLSPLTSRRASPAKAEKYIPDFLSERAPKQNKSKQIPWPQSAS